MKNELGRGVIINFSISTLNEKLAKIIEPGAPKPFERLETMKRCREEGFRAGISYIPALPFLSDSEEDLERMLEMAREYDAAFVFVGSLTLSGNRPYDCRIMYYRFLEEYYPELVPKYRNLFRRSFQPLKEYRRKLQEKVKELCEKYGVKNRLIQ